MTIHGRHSRTGHRWFPAILLSLVVAGVVGAAGFAGWVIAHDSTRPGAVTSPLHVSGDQRNTGSDTGNNAAIVRAAPSAAALNHCQVLFARQVRVALAADASLDQWRLHIQAMNQLVAGDISLAQASSYWNDTRVGAHRNAATFRRLDAALRRSHPRCAGPADPAASSSAAQRLNNCRAATSRLAGSMAAARPTVATWVHHIHDMNALRAGRITPSQATAMWTQSWHVGARQLRHYDRRAARALHGDCG